MRFLLLSLALVGCGTRFDAGGLDLPVDNLVASFVESGSASADLDEDGIGDITQNRLGIVLTDREDLCDLGGDVNDLDDVFAVQVVALTVGSPETLVSNTSLFEALLAPAQGQIFIGMRVVERVGGETVNEFVSGNLADGTQIGAAEMFINSQTGSDGSVRGISASFKAVLGGDITDPTAFDTNVDDDPENDFRAINESVKGRVQGADSCTSLGVIP